jgi:hypothetical protein
MATIKLGAFVTAIAGSVGGTTFKRNGSNTIIMNKSNGSSKSKPLQNQALGGLSVIFQQWSLLADPVKLAWGEVGQAIPVIDKFGDLKKLSGRQMFTKLSGQLLPTGYKLPDPVDINTVLEDWNFSDLQVNFDSEEILTTVSNISMEFFLLIQVEPIFGNIQAPVFNRRKIIFIGSINTPGALNLYGAIAANFPQLNNLTKFRVYYTVMNSSGFRSVPKTLVYNGVPI